MTGKLKTKGNIMLGTKLLAVLEVGCSDLRSGYSPLMPSYPYRPPGSRLNSRWALGVYRYYAFHRLFCPSRVVILVSLYDQCFLISNARIKGSTRNQKRMWSMDLDMRQHMEKRNQNTPPNNPR